jgi:hypothetical protein
MATDTQEACMRKLAAATTAGAIALTGLLAAAPPTGADGTETLGTPSIGISDGSGIAIGGTGLQIQPGTISVAVPAGATVNQVLLYWEGDNSGGAPPDATIVIEGTEVTGTLIGGETTFFADVKFAAFRADITALNLVAAGANSLDVSGLTNNFRNNGAGIAVIYDDGSDADLQLRDGLDLAFFDFAPPLDTTAPQTYTFDPEATDRAATLSLFAASVEDGRPRPNAVDVTVGGVTTRFTNPFTSNDGAEWDSVELTFTIPAGATSVTVQALSVGDGSGNLPASLAWIMSGLTVPTTPPPPPPDGCTLTPGYWKTHSEFGPAPFDATWALLPNGASTPFFDTGKTWYEAFHTAPAGKAYWILAHAWQAATLNGLAGTDTSAVTTQLAQAEALLNQYDGSPQPMTAVTGSVRAQFIALATILDDYNNGVIGPGHCGPLPA